MLSPLERNITFQPAVITLLPTLTNRQPSPKILQKADDGGKEPGEQLHSTTIIDEELGNQGKAIRSMLAKFLAYPLDLSSILAQSVTEGYPGYSTLIATAVFCTLATLLLWAFHRSWTRSYWL